MKIKIPTTLREPLTLRWNEMFNTEDRNELVHDICNALRKLCDDGIEIGIIQKTPISMMIGILQSVAEAAGAEDVWVEFNKCNNVDGDTILITYRLDFALPDNLKRRYGWLRVLPVA